MTKAITCSVRETAQMLDVSERHVYTLVKKGVLAKVPHLGRKTRIPRVAVEALVASAMPTPVPPGIPHSPRALAGVGIGGTAPASSGKWASAGSSTPEQGDGAGLTPDAVEERAAYSAQEAG